MFSRTKTLGAGFALAATLAVAGTASAATIIEAFSGGSGLGGAFQAGDIGGFKPERISKSNLYELTFQVAPGAVVVLSQVQASIRGPVSEPIDFTIWSGTPGSGTLVDTSATQTGPSLTDMLGVGTYYIKIGTITKNSELLSGALDVSAVPEPTSWALLLLGFGSVGVQLRRRRTLKFA